MKENYDSRVADHYSAYRPPLHELIVKRVLAEDESFTQGLDIGCGTGYSAKVLSNYCSHVFGVDPSQSMLDKASPIERVTYKKGSGEEIPVANHSVDIITLAGSLHYTKSSTLISELQRISKERATILVYDFEILLDPVMLDCEVEHDSSGGDYDYEINFSDCDGFIESKVGNELIHLDVSAENLAHILLSSTDRFNVFAKLLNTKDPFSRLSDKLNAHTSMHSLGANIFFSRYSVAKQRRA